jgi:glycosyltransferase involved in cell wall biosynthesis
VRLSKEINVFSSPQNGHFIEPEITIGLCVKNFEKYIAGAIESIVKQDFPKELSELIVVDGYSTDKTVNIIEQYVSKTKVLCRILYENKGLGVARQLVVDNAHGKYIVWVDGDLLLSKDYVRCLFNFMNQNPNIGIAKGKYSLESGANYVATLEIYARAAMKMVDFNSKINTDSIGTAGSIYRLIAIRQAGGFDTEIKGYGEDWDAERRVAKCGWSLGTLNVYYRDYERYGLNWKSLWKKYKQRGRDSYRIFYKNRSSIELYRWSPFAGLINGLSHSKSLYKLTQNMLAFLMPFQYVFKQSAWCYGFLIGQSNSNKLNHKKWN